LDAPTRAKALDAIHESATSQSRLVGDLLDVSRAINGKLRIDKQQVGIHELLTGVIEAAKPAAAARGVTLGHQLTGSTPFVVGDINRLRQIFRNLVGNAIACTPAGGRVTIETHVRNAMLEVAIVDNGRGIAPALLPHLFEPFRQAVDAPEGGLGLGLAVASQLVTLHGGTIVAESPGLGHGATFRVTVPRAPDGQRPVETVAKAARLGGINVLVVDDDARVLEALRLLLERAGAVVSTARSADAGYRTAERVLPDLVLSDLAMPDGDGCSMMRKIRAHETTGRRVPAVAMTAHVADINRQDALSSGFDRYVTKPLDIDQLITTIARLVPVAARE
ncbi:MAG TPA: hybrid sensor histidine kinase/response regulator, partial [Kofleriaceae bacterium]|nr:hybrid sensor histidine kinase/response regulator [Kofleriaceae bacterium]